MATVNSKNSIFKITDSGSTSRDLSTYISSIEGLPPDYDTDDTTTFGVSGHTYATTLTNGDFTISGPFDTTATSGPDVVLSGLYAAGAATAFEYAPAGTGTGSRKYSGNCIVTRYQTTSRVGNVVMFSATCRVTGAITVTVY